MRNACSRVTITDGKRGFSALSEPIECEISIWPAEPAQHHISVLSASRSKWNLMLFLGGASAQLRNFSALSEPIDAEFARKTTSTRFADVSVLSASRSMRIFRGDLLNTLTISVLSASRSKWNSAYRGQASGLSFSALQRADRCGICSVRDSGHRSQVSVLSASRLKRKLLPRRSTSAFLR